MTTRLACALLGSLLLTALPGCGAEDNPAPEAQPEVSSTTSELSVLTPNLWSSPYIGVCWENAGNDTEKAWVREAIENTWQMESNIFFYGWAPCDGNFNYGIRIRTANVWPLTRGLGTDLNNMTHGMDLNFWFTFWKDGKQPFSGCIGANREACIRNIAIHEFGHALGFAHEQTRTDTPATCTAHQEGGDTGGDAYVGRWDLYSVMNYCNPTDGSRLSDGDVAGAQQYYGGPSPAGFAASSAYLRGMDTGVWQMWPGTTGTTPSWWTQGGNITGTPAAASWAANRVDLFVRGSDGALWHRAYQDGWYNWESLGGSIVGNPVAVASGVNKLHIVVRGSDDRAYYLGWSTAGWSGYRALGGDLVTGQLAIADGGSNGLDVFWRGRDRSLWHVHGTQNFADAANRQAPHSLGGVLTSSPTAVAYGLGQVAVFARGLDGAVWQILSGLNGWGGWASLGGWITGNPSAVAVGTGLDPVVHVFARGGDGALWRRAQLGRGDWTSLGGNLIGSPAAFNTTVNNASIFVRLAGTNSLGMATEWLTHGVFSAVTPQNMGGEFR